MALPTQLSIAQQTPQSSAFIPVVTNDDTPTLSGTITDATVTTVEVSVNGETYTASITDDTWTMTVPEEKALPGGTYEVTLTLINGQGTQTTASIPEGLTIDLDVPAAPEIETPSGTANSEDVTVRGTAEAGSAVKIFDGLKQLDSVTADSDGKWQVTLQLDEGDYYLSATATDAAGNQSDPSEAIDLVVDFAAPDTTPPTILKFTPSDDATKVLPNAELTIAFDETVVKGAGAIKLYKADGTLVKTIQVNSEAVTIEVNEDTSLVKIDPEADLAAGDYYIEIPEGTFEDQAGNPSFAVMGDSAWNFSVALPDTTAPKLIAVTPADDATNVDPAANLTIAFDEPVSVGMVPSGAFTIYSASGAIVQEVSADRFSVSTDGKFVTIDPVADLASGTAYYIGMPQGLFRDAAANPSAALTGNSAWNFTTKAAPAPTPMPVPVPAPAPAPVPVPAPIVTPTVTPGSFGVEPPATAMPRINFNQGKPGRAVRGSNRADAINGTSGNDNQNLAGGDDRGNGGSGNDRINGGSGNDRLDGGSGNDELNGSAGNDSLVGGSGDDVLIGGTGQDTMNGGGGRDSFVYSDLSSGEDVIRGFNPAQDLLDLRGIFARPEFAGSSPVARLNQYIKLEQTGSGTQVKVDLDGNGAGTAFATLVTLQGVQTGSMTAKNFVIG